MKNSGEKTKSIYKIKKQNALIASLLFLGVFLIALGGFFTVKSTGINAKKYADDPMGQKLLNPNGDGTYKLSLSVTGDSDKIVPKVNVIVIVDRSNSMDSGSGTGAYVASNSNGATMYGLIDGEYKLLTRTSSGWGQWTTYTYSYNGTTYEGQRYVYDASATRLEATQAAVNGLANTLLSYNGKDGNPNDCVEMALVTFASTAQTDISKTSSADTYIDAVNGISTPGGWAGGTNWEAALIQANTISFGDSDPTYVIFFSDGSPTFRNTQAGFNDRDNRAPAGVYGSGAEEEPNMERAYNQATDDAQTLANKVGKDRFYTIFAYGTTAGSTYMTNLTTAAGAPSGNNYSASNTAELEDAFAAILEDIERAGIGNVEINDPTTMGISSTSAGIANLLEVDETSFTYYKNGQPWPEAKTDYPAELTDDGAVVWDLSGLELLEDGVKYEVKFDVYPSQDTYDLIADLKNGIKNYDDLDPVIKQYLHKDGNGYRLDTNTVDEDGNSTATITYTDSRIPGSGEQTYTYTNPTPVATEASQMAVEKKWENDFHDQDSKPITMELYKVNGSTEKKVEEMTLSDDNDWVDSKFIATGLLRTIKENGTITGIQVLDHGHDYTLKEKELTNPDDMLSYHWELVAETVRPMLIDGVLKTLIKVEGLDVPSGMTGDYYKDGDKEFYRIDGEVFYAKYSGTTANITATNYRKSNLNVMKTVTGDQLDDTEFTFNYTIKNEDDTEVWFSIWDTVNNKSVAYTDVDTDATPEVTDPQGRPSDYFYVRENGSGAASFYIKLQHGWNVRFINLGTGSEYTITEVLNSPYELTKVSADTLVTSTKVLPLGAVVNGTDSEGNKLWKYGDVIYTERGSGDNVHYDFTYTPEVNGKVTHGFVVAPNTSYSVEYVNNYPKTNLIVEKTWAQGKPKAGTKVNVVLYKNGVATDTKIELDGTADDNGETDTWVATFKDLDLSDANGFIDYSAKEEVVEGYKATYDGTTSVTVSAKNATGTVTATVKSDDETVGTLTLNKDNDWTDTLKSVDYINDDGSLKEISVTTSPNVQTTTVLSHRKVFIDNEETIEVEATKVWDDANNQDNVRPSSVTLQIKNGNDIVDTVTLDGTKDDDTTVTSETAAWVGTFKNLSKYDDEGNEITYTLAEKTEGAITGIDGPGTYAIKVEGDQEEGFTVTNKHTPETIEIPATKVWSDANNQDNARPTTITLNLKDSTGKVVDTVTLNGTVDDDTTVTSETAAWVATFKGLPKYKEGSVGVTATYTLEEVTDDVITGTDGPGTYAFKVEGTYDSGFTVTNTHTPEVVKAKVKKVWDDDNNRDKARPATLKVTLSSTNYTDFEEREVTLSGDSWEATEENLPKYVPGKVGVEAEYTWTEDETGLPDGYAFVSTVTEGELTTITNHRDIDTVKATIVKVWDDDNNRDKVRPESLDVVLHSSDEEFDDVPVTLTAKDEWTATIEDLPKNVKGKVGVAAEYSWTEDSDSIKDLGYTQTGNTTAGEVTTITNHRDIDTVKATVVKVWDDDNNRDKVRPESLDVVLHSSDEEFDDVPVTLTAKDEWTATIEDLPKNVKGKEGVAAEYSWTEDSDSIESLGYTQTGNTTAGEVTTITNHRDIDTTSATVKKVWDDDSNRDKVRPASINVVLHSSDENFDDIPVTLEGTGDEWTTTITGLPVNVEGKVGVAAEYSWTEDEEGLPEGYTLKSISTAGTVTTITNHRDIDTVKATVVKVWDDDEDRDGVRPTSLDVVLHSSDDEFDDVPVTLTAKDEWTATINDLPKNVKGKVGVAAEYSWTEDSDSIKEIGYTQTGNTTAGEVTTITNHRDIDTTEATVKKVWDDNNDQDGVRPKTLTVILSDGIKSFEPVTLNESNNWTATIDELPKYRDGGQEITYSWTEDEESVKEVGYELTGNDTVGTVTTLTNKYSPEETEATVKKVWDDANDQDGKRPTKLVVTLSDGTMTFEPVTLTEANEWTATIDGLPKYKDGGQEITYTWTEDEESVKASGYELTDTSKQGTVTTFTNSYTPETTESTVLKVWDDDNDRDGKQPPELKVTLNDADNTEVTLNAENQWTATVTGLPKYENHGQEIDYRWTEEKPEEYTIKSNEKVGKVITITNHYDPEKTYVCVKKVWDDDDNRDDIRPDTLTLSLTSDDESYEGDSVTLSEENNWKEYVRGLFKYHNHGQEVKYEWSEEDLPEGYTLSDTSTDTDGNGAVVTTLTNTHDIELTEATVKKVWDDAEDQDGKRPETLSVKLLGNEQPVQKDGEDVVVTLSESTDWTATVKGLPLNDKGTAIDYTWEEVDLPTGYELTDTSKSGTVTTLTNTHEPEKIDIPVKKEWVNNDPYGFGNPTSVVVNLLDNGKVVGTKTLSAENNWTDTFTGLDKYRDGQEIPYEVKEEAVLDYDTEYQGSIAEGFTVVNTYNPTLIPIEVTKTWDDANDQDGVRPETIKMTLIGKVNGEVKYTSATETVTDADYQNNNTWKHTFTDLPKRYLGQEIEYSVVETLADDSPYTGTSVTDLEIKNHYDPQTITFNVTKSWDDDNDNDGRRPKSITVHLLKDGTEIQTETITEEKGWNISFGPLAKFRDHGVEIEYLVIEDPVEYYENTDTSYTPKDDNNTNVVVVNTHEREKTQITISKVWKDNDNKLKYRPNNITVEVYADGKLAKTVTISADDDWTLTVEGLDKFANGKEIEYTIKEKPVAHYTTAISGTDADGFTITNTVENPPEIVPPNTGITGISEATDKYLALLMAILAMFASVGIKRVFE
ncbi:MAG: Cna B-type domain-containing protein [Bacilli bacterium]|nr:Cna B-type domain-containing protein [Bacilli bacterium]